MNPHFHFYKAIWYWKEDNLGCYIHENVRNKLGKKQLTKQLSVEDEPNKILYFSENVDHNQQKIYKFKYQRTLKANVQNVVTMQDIKDVVTYLLIGKMPKYILGLFHCQNINELCRALIVYMQLYLQVWNDLIYRRNAYACQRLKHPTSIVRETLCRTYLSKLRSRIGKEYALIIAGQGKYVKVHHMNNPINRSYTTKDIKLYDYLFTFCARVVWVALGRSNYKEIETEISRMFHYKQPTENSIISSETDSDITVLRGSNIYPSSCWRLKSPAINEVFINQYEPESLELQFQKVPNFKANEISGLEVALTFPEELLAQFGITVGILGLSRENFEPLLQAKQEINETTFEQEIEAALGSVQEQPEQPWIKMYEFIRQLSCTIDLTSFTPSYGLSNIKEEIQFYLGNHIEDGKKSYRMWKIIKITD